MNIFSKWMPALTRSVCQLCIATLVIGLVLVAQPAQRAEAAIGFVQNVGTAQDKTSGSTLVITAASGAAAGNSIIISFAMNPGAGVVTATDSGGNAYAVDADVTFGTNLRTVILSAHNIAAIAPGGLITITHPTVGARAANAAEFSGLAPAGALDRTATGTGTGTAASSGTTAVISQPDELLVGAIGVEGPLGETFTPGAGYTALTANGTTGGFSTSNMTIRPEYRIVSATGAYAANGTLSTSRDWAAAIATYRMAPPTVQFSSATYSVDEAAGTAAITVTMSSVTALTVTVPFTTTDGAATAGSDYLDATGTLTFTPGVTTTTATVPVINDTTNEADETVALALGSPTNATLGSTASAVLTILDNDAAPTVQFDAAAYSVNEGAGTATITATLSAASGQTVTVNYATADNTATAGSDYTSASGTLTFTAGVTSQTFTVSITDDSLDEIPTELVTLSLSGATNATLGAQNAADLQITDNDAAPTVQFDATTYTVDEGAGTATITVTLSAASGQSVTVDYATSDGAAQAGSDYLAVTGTLTFTPGSTQQTFDVPLTDDALDEANEALNLTLSSPTNASLGSPNPASLTIADNDPTPTVQFSSANYSAGEGDGTATITVTLSAASGQTVTVDYATADNTATAGSDYLSTTGTLTFTPGLTEQTFNVSITDDSLDEIPTELVALSLSGATNATLGAQSNANLQIADNDNPPTVQLSASVYSINENGGSALITVTLSTASELTVTVAYATADNTAQAGSDYTTAAGTLTFTAGVTEQTFNVAILDDLLDEIPTELVALSLSGATNATLGAQSTADLQIADNDAAPTVQFSGATYSAGEGDGTAAITVTLSAASALTATVDYATADSTATAGNDYLAATGTLTFTPGVTEQTFSVTVLNDTLDEIPTELVALSLSGATNATLGAQNTADLQIADNDNPPTVQFDAAAYNVNEGAGSATITVTLSAASALTATVDYATSDNSALAGSDYVTATGALTFTPGATSQTFSVSILNDVSTEASEALTLTLSAPVNATPGSITEAALNIADDDTVTDLAVFKTDNQITMTAGSLITYTIVVSNQGAIAAPGATVSDTLPAVITGATWTCAASAGSSCTASGAGDLSDTPTLLAGGSATYTVSGTVALTAVGTLTNTVTVSLPVGLTDSDTGNNTSVDTTDVLPPIPVTGGYQVFLPLILR